MNETLFFSFEDLKRIFRKRRVQLNRIALYSGCSIFVLLLFQAPEYAAFASFKQSSGKNSSEMIEFKNLIKNGLFFQSEPGAMAIMRSKRLMHAVMQEMGLQIEVAGTYFFLKPLMHGWDNILAELRCVLGDTQGFEFQKVIYEGEERYPFFLQFTTPDHFIVSDNKKNLLGEGKVGEKIELPTLQFTLIKTPKNLRLTKQYSATVYPWMSVAEKLLARFELKTSKIDKELLHLTFTHKNRHTAAEFLNQVMAQYQAYLKDEDEQIAKSQLAYLEKRQEELLGKLDVALAEHVAYMKNNLGEEGFIGLNQEIERLSLPKEEYTTRLFNIDLRLKRFQNKGALTCDATGNVLQKKLYQLEEALQRKKGIEPVPSTAPALDLKTTKKMHERASQELDEVRTAMRQLLFLKEEIENPEFELASLTAILTDSVSQDMIRKAAELSLELKDEANRGLKNIERLKEALGTQKRFIQSHIEQMGGVYALRAELLEEKIASLSQNSVHLLQNEKKLIEGKLNDLREKMGVLPEKWRLENELKFKKDLTLGMIEGMTQLVESKNINHHLHQIESKPLDVAFPSRKPKSPHLFSLSLVAAFAGAFSLFGVYFGLGWRRGFPASLKSLEGKKGIACGALSSNLTPLFSELNHTDLETLRQVAARLRTQVVGLIGYQKADYAHHLAKLLSIQGLKVVLVEADFNKEAIPGEVSGLRQYLEGDKESVLIQKYPGYDFVPSGGISRYATELLRSDKFLLWLRELKRHYTVVLLFSPTHPASAEAQVFLEKVDGMLVVLSEATNEDLSVYEAWQQTKQQHTLFYIEMER